MKLTLGFLNLLILFSIISTCGCILSDDKLSSSSYIVIQEVSYDHGTVIAGDSVPHNVPPPEFYSYDDPSKYVRVNSSFKALHGYYYEKNSPWNYTTNLTVSGIYDYPYRLRSGVIIDSIDSNGTAYMTYNGERITLKIGGIWSSGLTLTRIVNETLVVPDYNVNMSSTVQYNTSWIIENKGLYSK
ncbi:MAG: hypothetical protein WBZ29_15410 [Methanocella sp.]